jgi:hypothetical protein
MRGEVSSRKMYIGGLSYFSSGSVGSGLRGGACPEVVASATSEIRKVKMLVFDAVTQLKVDKARLHLILIIMGYECWLEGLSK